MRDSVTVDGITLTRQQIEAAVKKLDAPQFKRGDVVMNEFGKVMVVLNRDDSYLSKRVHEMDSSFAAIATESGSVDGFVAESLRRIGTLAEIVAFYRQAKGL